ncbi:MAG: hypothetical protein AAF456_05605 [Planctomycetota bacterium]
MNLRSTLFVILLTVGFLLTAGFGCYLSADQIVFDGTHDNNWTNGPNFPNSGTIGANWTINGGPAGQLVVPDPGAPSNNIGYLFSGHDWTIENSTIAENVQIKLNGGSLAVSRSSISLQPTTAKTNDAISGLNFGEVGIPTTFSITDSTVTLGRSRGVGMCMRVTNGSVGTFHASTLIIDSEVGVGSISVRDASSLTFVDSEALIENGLVLESTGTQVRLNDSTIYATHVRTNEFSQVVLDGSSCMVLTSDNPLRSQNNYFNDLNVVSREFGVDLLVCTNLAINNTNLAAKVAQGFFSLDGVQIRPEVDNSDWTDRADQKSLNTALEGLAVNGRFLRVIFTETDQRLQVAEPGPVTVVPESVVPAFGDLVSGGLPELAEDDGFDYVMSRRISDLQARTQFDVAAVSPAIDPSHFELTVKASVFARGTVTQSVDLFNYDSGTWEQVDSRLASRFGDTSVSISPIGDLSRFVEPGTCVIEARVRHRAVGQRQQFSTRTDRFVWAIE